MTTDCPLTRLRTLIRGKIRERSLAAIIAAEGYLAGKGEGILILQMAGGLLDVSFLPAVPDSTWEVILRPTELS
ncbi:MAG: hypothetical protein ACXVYY_00910 [Oryzihumus sp.]